MAIQLWIGVGSAQDPSGRQGLAHLLEHLVFKGTRRRSGAAIEAAIEERGGEIGAWTGLDRTVFQVSIASRYLDLGLDVLADLALRPRLDPAALEQERGVVLEELRSGAESALQVNTNQLLALAYGRHAYGRPVIGSVRSVAAISPGDVRRFHAAMYVPGNMTLVMVGDVDSARALASVRRRFCGPRAAARPTIDAPSTQRGVRVSVQRLDGASARVSLAFRIPRLEHEDVSALELAALILGEGESSRLARRLKRGRHPVAACHAQVFSPDGPGLFVLGATTSSGQVKRVTRALLDEVAALGRVDVAVAELERARRVLEADAALQRQTSQDRAHQLGLTLTATGRLEHELLWIGRISSATPASLRAAASRQLQPRGLSIAALCPDRPASDLAAELKRVARASFAQAPASTQPSSRQPRIVRLELESGARLLIQHDSALPMAAVRAIWQGGQRLERARTRGVSNLLASLLTRGAAARSGEQIHADIEALPGSISGCFGENSLGLQMELLARQQEPGLEILADCAIAPRFSQGQIELAQREALETLCAVEADPTAAAMARFLKARYGDHPYGASLFGTAQALASITRDQIVRHFKRRYHPSGLVVAVVGDVDVDSVAAWFERRLGAAQSSRGASAPRVAPAPRRDRPVGVIGLHETRVAHVVLGFAGTTKRGRDRVALEVLGALLAERGRLFVELRQRHGLAYHLDHVIFDGVDPGHFALYVATSPAALAEVLTRVMGQLEAVRRAPVPARELERTQRFMVGSHERSLQDAATVAQHLAYDELYGRGHLAHQRYAAALMRLTPRRVQQVARRFLARREMIVSMSLPKETTAAEQQQLRELLARVSRPKAQLVRRAKPSAPPDK